MWGWRPAVWLEGLFQCLFVVFCWNNPPCPKKHNKKKTLLGKQTQQSSKDILKHNVILIPERECTDKQEGLIRIRVSIIFFQFLGLFSTAVYVKPATPNWALGPFCLKYYLPLCIWTHCLYRYITQQKEPLFRLNVFGFWLQLMLKNTHFLINTTIELNNTRLSPICLIYCKHLEQQLCHSQQSSYLIDNKPNLVSVTNYL